MRTTYGHNGDVTISFDDGDQVTVPQAYWDNALQSAVMTAKHDYLRDKLRERRGHG